MKRANGEAHADGPAQKRSNEGARYQPSQKFRLELVIDDLSDYMGLDEPYTPDDVDGPIVIVGSSEWSLCAQVYRENGSVYFAVYLGSASPGADWRLMLDYAASVVGSAAPKVERGMKMAESSGDLCVFSEEKQVLLDPANNYITDGAFKMEVDVTIYEPYRMLVDFFTADSNYNADVVLRVQDRRFHVNKAYLGHESDVFYQMFFGPLAENSREEVPLGDVDADEFLQFLGAIHRMRAPITDDNAVILTKLAGRFQVVWLFGDCENYLLRSDRFTVVQKLIISTEVSLDELQKNCLDELTLKDVDELIDTSKEEAMGVGCLLQELLSKQKKLMESKHKRAIRSQANEHNSAMSSLKAKVCTRCRNKLS